MEEPVEYSLYCESCNKKKIYKTVYNYKRALRGSKLCTSCCLSLFNKTRGYSKGKNNSQWISPNEIPYSWFSKYFIRRSKNKRTGTITIDDVYLLWIKQNKKCALSGVSIGFNDDKKGHTCSIDRINSKLEYDINNIQLVHKDINLMKNRFDQDYFINMCKLVSGGACEV